MTNLIIIFTASIFLILTGCTGYYTPLGGAIFNNTTQAGQSLQGATSIKTGTACATNIMGIFASGDSSITAAKNNADITKVATVDYKINNIIFYGKICTIVTGE